MNDQAPRSQEPIIGALATRLAALETSHPTRVAVDGPDMAGKTTLADMLAESIRERSRDVIRASADDFHHPRAVRYRRGKESPEGYYHDAFDVTRLRDLLLRPLGPGGNRRYVTQVFDWRTDTPATAETRMAPDDAILIVDGVFLLRPELRECWDYSIFVWASEPERLSRSKVRDLEHGGSTAEIERLFWARYAPAHRLYWRTESPQRWADAFIDNEQPFRAFIRYRERES